ncbi:MAG: YceI family protein [Bradymonadaceae bacterium]
MSSKIILTVLAASLTLAMACKSEIDGKTAATVGEVQEPAAEQVDEEKTEASATSLRQIPVNTEASKIEWYGAKVTGDHKGGFTEWTGTATVDGENNLKSVSYEVDMSSVFSDNERLTGHLKSDDFFDIENHPTSTFESTKIVEGAKGEEEATHTVTGNLSLRGVTKELSFPATIKTTDDKLVATSEFKFNRMEFNVAYKGKADDLIREDVAMTLHFEVPLSEAPAAAAAE